MGWFTDNDIIWQASANEIIKYIDQDTSSLGENDHPANLTAKEISTILASLKFREQEEDNFVFTDQQANLLGRYLEEGLKAALPHQDIIFVMEKSVKRLTL